jgi:hypothetical protein
VAGLALFGNVATAEPSVQLGQAWEGHVLQMALPDGFVFTDVLFASYGLPSEFTLNPACHASTSVSVVSSVAVGQQAFTLDATNGRFMEDPCPGVYKHLQVVLAVGPVETTTSSTEAPTTTTSSVPTTEVSTTVDQPTTTEALPIEETTTVPVPSTETIPQPVFSTPSLTSTSVATTVPEATTIPATTEVATTWPQPTASTTATITPLPSTTLSPTSTQAEATTTTEPAPTTTPTTTEPPTNLIVDSVFDFDTSELTQSDIDLLIEQVQDAPEEVRQEFEAQVDLYSGQFDSYVPLGSSIPVGARRVVIAVSVATTLPVARRRSV